MKDWLEIKFFQFVKRKINRDYGYCQERCEDHVFMKEGTCAACTASDVQDWIDDHINLIKSE
ncbi:MAG TPA: hypothetical protein VJJ48_00885 [Candidatus Paceibacterota bacterium]